MAPKRLLMQSQMRLGDIAQAAIGRRRVGVDGAQGLGEGDDLPVGFEGLVEFAAHDLLQRLHVEVVGQLVDLWVYGDGGFGVGLVVVLVDVGEDFVEDVGVQFLEVDVLRLSFLGREGEEVSLG